MFHIILFNPLIPPNTGNIIRLCANAGANLHLIKPLGFRLNEKSFRRAGLDYHLLTDIYQYDSLEECLRSLGKTRVFVITKYGNRQYSDAKFERGDTLLFGNETSGLPEKLICRFAETDRLFIPMKTGQRSLNLSNAVALTLYEAWRQNDYFDE